MKYSIIIPTHNRPKQVEKLLVQLLKIQNCEVVIVENNSSEERLREYRQIELLKNQKIFYTIGENIGAGDARNFGIEKAKGTYIFFLDDDDVMTNEFIDLLNSFSFTEDVYRFPYWINNKKRKPSLRKYVTKTFIFDSVQPSTFLTKREYVLKNKIAFAKTVVHQDNHFAEMVWSANAKQYVLNVPSIHYTTNNESIQRSNKFLEKELKSIREFEDAKYKNGNIFRFKLIVNINEFIGKYSFDVDAKEVKNSLISEFKKIKGFTTFYNLPIYYKFIYIAWLFKITTSRK